MKNSKRLLALAVSAALAAPMTAFATNGMNLEGYGPIATGMGGASMAYDNGTAAMMNNPATLGLGDEGNRLDIAFGVLGPKISVSRTSMPDADSDSTSFKMPALGWTNKNGKLTYGAGMFAQGGMGTEYSTSTWMSGGGTSDNYSEVGVGRLVFPVAYQMNQNLTLGGSVDYVWAGMDLRMMMAGSTMMDMMPTTLNPGATNYMGTMDGSLVNTMGNAIAGGMMNAANPLNSGYFDFADSDPMRGEARGAGFAGKIGLTFKASDKLTIGATYHSKTSMGDLETTGASVSFNANMDDNVLNGTYTTAGMAGTYTAATIGMTGDIAVVDFQWPSTMGIGIAFQATDSLKLVADVKTIAWSGVMDTFKVKFTPDSTQGNPLAQAFVTMGGELMNVSMNQKWEDQTVIALGAAYDVNKALTLRVGYNKGSNPTSNDYLNPLFPATVENHTTLGMGYKFNDASSVDFSFTQTAESNEDITQNGASTGMSVSHSQTNYQLMYSMKF